MKLSDVYKHKDSKKLIQIIAFATPMGRMQGEGLIIVFSQLHKMNERVVTTPSQYGYGTEEEIEEEYELFLPQEEVRKYDHWDEIFKLLEEK